MLNCENIISLSEIRSLSYDDTIQFYKMIPIVPASNVVLNKMLIVSFGPKILAVFICRDKLIGSFTRDSDYMFILCKLFGKRANVPNEPISIGDK